MVCVRLHLVGFGRDISANLVAEDAQAWQGFLLALVLGDLDEGRSCGFGLGGAEHLLVGLELELEGAVTVG